MNYNVHAVYPDWNFEIHGSSYAGKPENGTMMYITAKVGHLINNLVGYKECLCFIQEGIEIPEKISQTENAIIKVQNPQFEYAKMASIFQMEERKYEKKMGYVLSDGGYYIGADVKIGKNAYIEPGVIIGNGVCIGDNAVILSGAVIKRARIGNDFLCNEKAVIGGNSFTMAEDEAGNKFRIPSLGHVVIGNHVEVGVCDNIACGACGDTILEDYVKLDGLVHIGHEAHLEKNVEVTAGAIVAGFGNLGVHTYLGVNSSIRNRIDLGRNTLVGMGAVVTKSVEAGITVIGNPAHIYEKKK